MNWGKTHVLLLLLMGFCTYANAQQIQLFIEDFEGGNQFSLNSDTNSVNTGDNRWIVNREFDGQNIYPNTTRQDSVTSGTINNAPFSRYLHIRDSSSLAQNASYNPSNASDNFAAMSNGFCTLGLRNVSLSFFYLAEGDADAYGEVYYSANNGPWVKTGAAKYNNQDIWRFVPSISDTAFQDVEDLRFGFRWVNDASTDTASISFSLDEIQVVASYDSSDANIGISIPLVLGTPVCQGETFFFQYAINQPLCNGVYRLEISNRNGGFVNPTNLGTVSLGPLDTLGFFSVPLPNAIVPDTCYRIRLIRTAPFYQVIGEQSACFQILDCPVSVETLADPVVLTDPDTACIYSAIDVQFLSFGVFNPGNLYIAELIDSTPDSNGMYPPPQLLGQLPSAETFDNPFMPGSVSGLIPLVPPGCNYYVRVNSTNPPAFGTIVGPYCLTECDVSTNNYLDLSLCISQTVGIDTAIAVDINTFDTTCYFNGNSFQAQVLDRMTLAVINTGELGVKFDTTSGQLILSVPGRDSLPFIGMKPGSFYLRIVTDSTCEDWDETGTIIRLTIGAPNDVASLAIPSDTFYCNTEIASFLIQPYNQESDYEWLASWINNGVAFEWPNNPLNVNLTGSPPGFYGIRVRENNYGCYGPFSPLTEIAIGTIPSIDITGPTEVCQGDSVTYDVLFIPETFYGWGLTWGTITDTSNNEITIVWDSVGTVDLSLTSLNQCGNGQGAYTVNISKLVDVEAFQDTAVCEGEPVSLTATTSGFRSGLTTTFAGGPSNRSGAMFDVKALDDVVIRNFSANIRKLNAAINTADFEIYYKTGSYAGSENDPSDWSLLDTANNVLLANVNSPTNIPGDLNLPLTPNRTYAFYITTSTTNVVFAMTNNTTGNSVIATDGIIEVTDGDGLNHSFIDDVSNRIFNGIVNYDTEAGLLFEWRASNDSIFNGRTITVEPFDTTAYTVSVFDTSGCSTRDKVEVVTFKYPVPVVEASDTLVCPGDVVSLVAQGGDIYDWSTSEQLSDPSIFNPTVAPIESATYNVAITNSETKCTSTADIIITVDDCQLIIQVAEAFTPNQDGRNDYFTVFGDDIVDYEIKIFNRWGELVYYSDDPGELNDFNDGWDGTYKGEPQKMDTYVYFIVANGIGAQQTELKGNLTLIR